LDMPTIDKPLRIDDDKICQRCGHFKSYHKMIVNDKVYLPCIRKKPYKLADGVDVKLGMQVWQYHPWDDSGKIITGMVRFISGFGGLTLWKYPEDRNPDRVFDLAHDGHFTARVSCFSSLENAQAAVEKRKKEKAALDKWIEKNKVL